MEEYSRRSKDLAAVPRKRNSEGRSDQAKFFFLLEKQDDAGLPLRLEPAPGSSRYTDGRGGGTNKVNRKRPGGYGSSIRRFIELEFLRSHPKDERGSVREIGLGDRHATPPLFSRLSLMAQWFFAC